MATLDPIGTVTWIYTDELERSIRFYENALGLPVLYATERARIFSTGPGGRLGVCQAPATSLGTAGIMYTFLCTDIEDSYRRLGMKGVTFDAPPAERADSFVAFFRDPAGYRLEIQQYKDTTWITSPR